MKGGPNRVRYGSDPGSGAVVPKISVLQVPLYSKSIGVLLISNIS